MQSPASGRKKTAPSHQSTARSGRSSSSHSRSLSRQSNGAALPIAEPFDPSKEAVEIELLTSAIVLPADSVPPLPPSPTSSSLAGSAIGTPRLRFETFQSKVDYRYDGDRWMDTDAMMSKRRKLKQDEAIQRWVNVFWRTFHHQLPAEPAAVTADPASSTVASTDPASVDPSSSTSDQPPAAEAPVSAPSEEDDPFAPKKDALMDGAASAAPPPPPPPSFLRGTIDRRQYMSVHKLWFKALHKLYDRSDAHVQAIKDWARDSWLSSAPDHATLDHPAFVDALFELVDIWTLTVEPTEYVHFLATLYHRVTRVKSWLGDDGALITKYVWRKTRYVKPSAVYRPYQYHKYKDVKWKAANEVIHHLDSDDSSDDDDGDRDDEEDGDDALIRDLRALSDEDIPSSPSTESSVSESEDEDDDSSSLLAASAALAMPTRSTVTPATTPLPPRRIATVPMPLLAIDPERVLRQLTEVDMEPPKSPYLDPPAVIPMTPNAHPSSSDSEDDVDPRERRAIRRSRRSTAVAPLSSGSELDEDDPLLSAASLHAQARYNTAIDVLEQQRNDRYLLLVANVRTLLETTHRRLNRSVSVIAFTSAGAVPMDVDASLRQSRADIDEWADAQQLAGTPQRRSRRRPRTVPIGCLVDDDERYVELRGDGRRRHSAPFDLASFACAGPMMYAEGAGPGDAVGDGGHVGPAREPPSLDFDDNAERVTARAERTDEEGDQDDGDAKEECDAEDSAEATAPAVQERPESSDMPQDEFSVYIAELTEEATSSPKLEPKRSARDPPTESSLSLADLPSSSPPSRDIDSAPVPAPPSTAGAPQSPTEASPTVRSPAALSPPLLGGALSRKKRGSEVRPPSPVFAQLSQRAHRQSVSEVKTPSKKQREVRASRASSDAQSDGDSAKPSRRSSMAKDAAKNRANTASPPAQTSSLVAITEESKKPAPPPARSPQSPPVDGLSQVVHTVLARQRGTQRAAAKMVEARDKRLADMSGVRIRDEALAAEYDEENMRRGSIKRGSIQLTDDPDAAEEDTSRTAEPDAEADSAAARSEDERWAEAMARKKEAEERRRKEEDEKKRRKDADDKRAMEERLAALKAEKELFTLLHEAESQRKVEQQLKQQKRDLVSREKANKRRREKEEREKAAEAAVKADEEERTAHKEAAAAAAATEAAQAGAKPPKLDRKRSSSQAGNATGEPATRAQAPSKHRTVTIKEGHEPEADEVAVEEAADTSPSTLKEAIRKSAASAAAPSAADARKADPAAAKRSAAERKAKLLEDERVRVEALRARQEAEGEASKQLPPKKLLKARSVKKPTEDAGVAIPSEDDDGSGKVKIRADFMRSKKLEQADVVDDGSSDPREGAAARELKEEVKGGRFQKENEVGEDAAAEALSERSVVDGSAVKAKRQGQIAALSVSRRPKDADAPADEAEGEGATEEAKKRRPNAEGSNRRAKLPTEGDGEVDSADEDDSVADVGRPLRLRNAKKPLSRSTVDSDGPVDPTSPVGSHSPLRSPKLRSPKQRRVRKVEDAAATESLLESEAEKLSFGADWSVEKKRAYREAEYVKEKEEEKAALVKSGEHGLVELRWAQKMDGIRRKEERARALEERERRRQEIEDSKRARAAEKHSEPNAKEQRRVKAAGEPARSPLHQEGGPSLRSPKGVWSTKGRSWASQKSPKARQAGKGDEDDAEELSAEDSAVGAKGARSGVPARSVKRRSGALAAVEGGGGALSSSPRSDEAAAATENGEVGGPAAAERRRSSVKTGTGGAPDAGSSSSVPTAAVASDSSSSSRVHQAPHRMPAALKTDIRDVEPKVVPSPPTSQRALRPAQPGKDPRKLAAQTRREEAQRRIDDMRRAREEKVQAQADGRRVSVAHDGESAPHDVESATLAADDFVEAKGADLATGTVRLKDNEVKYWSKLTEPCTARRSEAGHEVRIVDDPAAAGRLASTPDDIQRELALLKRPQRSWGMALSKGTEDEIESKGPVLDARAQVGNDEEVVGWEKAPTRPAAAAVSAAAVLHLPVVTVSAEPLSARGLPTPGRDVLIREPRVLEQRPPKPSLSLPHSLSTLPVAVDDASPEVDGGVPSARLPLEAEFVLSARPAELPAPADPDEPLTPVAARRAVLSEEEKRALAALHEGTDRSLDDARGRRWLLLEELMGEVKERSQRWQKRRGDLEERFEADRAAIVKRREIDDAGWQARRRDMEHLTVALRQERRAAREVRRAQSERRKEQRAAEAEELKAMREDILREKETRRKRKREEKEALMHARLTVQRQREEDAENRRRAEEDRAAEERRLQEQQREETERLRERERQTREEEKAAEEQRTKALEEEVRAQARAQHKQEKERRKAEKDARKREETRQRVLAALEAVERAAQGRAQQAAVEREARDAERRLHEEALGQRVRAVRAEVHAELHRWWDDRRQRVERVEREHRRQVLEDEEKRREEVIVLRQHKQRARSSPSLPASPTHLFAEDAPWKAGADPHKEPTSAALTSSAALEARKEERMRVEMNAKRALDRLLTQRAFLHLGDHQRRPSLLKPRRGSSPAALPPLHPVRPPGDEEEKTALSVEHSPSGPGPHAFPMPPPANRRHPPLLVQGNPWLHSGWSWRPDLAVRSVHAGLSPILPPCVVKRVRDREGRGALGLGSGREEPSTERRPEHGSAVWGNADAHFELVGRKQRAFVKRSGNGAHHTPGATFERTPRLTQRNGTVQRAHHGHGDGVQDGALVEEHKELMEPEPIEEATAVSADERFTAGIALSPRDDSGAESATLPDGSASPQGVRSDV